LIVNRLRPEMVERGDMLSVEDICDILAIKLVGVIPEDDNIVISTNKGEPVIGTENAKAGQALMNLTDRVLGKDIPYMDLKDKPKGFLATLRSLFAQE